MKKYVPLKYLLGMILMFFIAPIVIVLLMVFVIGLNDFTIAISLFFGALFLLGPFVYFKNQENASIVIKNNTITNHINDGTSNFGWTEEIGSIRKITLVNNEVIKKHFKNCKAKKVLLIDLGEYNVKYISASLFTKHQIKRILKDLNK